MKTVRLLKTEDHVCIQEGGRKPIILPGHYMTEDGLFEVHHETKGVMSTEEGWMLIAVTTRQVVVKGLASLRCARVWIKNFYRTMTFKKPQRELVSLTYHEKCSIMYLQGGMEDRSTFCIPYDDYCIRIR